MLVNYLVIAIFIGILTYSLGALGLLLAIIAIIAIKRSTKKPIKTTAPKASTIISVPPKENTLDDIRAMYRKIFYNTDMRRIPEFLHSEYRAYLKTKEWQTLRKEVIKRDNFRCQHCGYIGDKLQVHHITYEGIFELTFTLDQLVTLCDICHAKEHEKEYYELRPTRKPSNQ